MSLRIADVLRLALVSILLATLSVSAAAQEASSDDAPAIDIDEAPADLGAAPRRVDALDEAPADLGAPPRRVDLPTPELDDGTAPRSVDRNPPDRAPVTSPGAARSPVGMREFDEIEAALHDTPSVAEEWRLDDGVSAEEVPWNDYDPVSDYTPDGLLHAGLSLRLAWLPGGPEPLPDGPMLELGLFGDVRYGADTAWHLRAAIAIAYQPYSDEYLGGGLSRTTSPFAVKFRLQPIAFDIGNYVSLRAGGDVGFQWVPRADTDGEVEAFGGASAEGVIRLLDGFLEVGILAGFQLTAYGELSRINGYRTQLGAEGLLGLTAAYLIL